MSQQTFEILVAAAILVPLAAFLWLELHLWLKRVRKERDMWFGIAVRSSFKAAWHEHSWDWPKR